MNKKEFIQQATIQMAAALVKVYDEKQADSSKTWRTRAKS